MADRVTVNSAAMSLTVRGCDASSCRIRRRFGSAAAEQCVGHVQYVSRH